jgi:uncharacterized membrane protein YidH (DUF202 family)
MNVLNMLLLAVLTVFWILGSLAVKSFCDTTSKFPPRTNLEYWLGTDTWISRRKKIVRAFLIIFSPVSFVILLSLVVLYVGATAWEKHQKRIRRRRYKKFISK